MCRMSGSNRLYSSLEGWRTTTYAYPASLEVSTRYPLCSRSIDLLCQNRTDNASSFAIEVGFEPTRPGGLTVFKTASGTQYSFGLSYRTNITTC